MNDRQVEITFSIEGNQVTIELVNFTTLAISSPYILLTSSAAQEFGQIVTLLASIGNVDEMHINGNAITVTTHDHATANEVLLIAHQALKEYFLSQACSTVVLHK